MKKIIFVVFVTLAVILNSCECVVESDTDKIITPTEFAKIAFINASTDEDLSDIIVYSASKILDKIDTITNDWQFIEANYQKVGIKVANQKNTLRLVSLYDTTQILFNSVLDAKKDSNYSFVAFGKNKYIQSIFVTDYIETFNPDNVYFRFFNAIPDSPELLISVETEGYLNEFSIKAGEATKIFALPNGKFKITVNSNDSSFQKVYDNIDLNQGKLNNFLLKGIFKNKSIDYGIVSLEI